MSGRRLPGPERRAQLLEVARGVLARRGYHDTSMNDIAAAAGVTKPVLYQHFESKRRLFSEVLSDVGVRFQASIIGAASQESSPRGQVEAGIAAYVRYVTENSDGFHLLFSSTTRTDEEWRHLVDEVEDSLVGAIADLIVVDGIAQAHRVALAHGVVGSAESMMRHWRVQGEDLDRDELIENLTKLVWGGLRSLD